jgi:hypothetical protein
VFIDNDFPKILGAELYRPHPAYIAEMAVEPVVVHDFTRQPGQTVQLDRYKFWGTPRYLRTARERVCPIKPFGILPTAATSPKRRCLLC